MIYTHVYIYVLMYSINMLPSHTFKLFTFLYMHLLVEDVDMVGSHSELCQLVGESMNKSLAGDWTYATCSVIVLDLRNSLEAC